MIMDDDDGSFVTMRAVEVDSKLLPTQRSYNYIEKWKQSLFCIQRDHTVSNMLGSMMKSALQKQTGSWRRMSSVLTQQHVVSTPSVPLWDSKFSMSKTDSFKDPRTVLLNDINMSIPQTVHGTNNMDFIDSLIKEGWTDPADSLQEEISVLNRNARRPKKANKGARPCSRAARRWKKEKIGKRRR